MSYIKIIYRSNVKMRTVDFPTPCARLNTRMPTKRRFMYTQKQQPREFIYPEKLLLCCFVAVLLLEKLYFSRVKRP